MKFTDEVWEGNADGICWCHYEKSIRFERLHYSLKIVQKNAKILFSSSFVSHAKTACVFERRQLLAATNVTK